MNARTTFQTDQASRLMTGLCDHFARKLPVQKGPQSGRIEFPFGACDLAANSTCLQLSAWAADREQLETLVEIITNHLERFAFRERPNLTWHFTET